MNAEQQRIAQILLDARAEALSYGGPHSCASLNSVIRRLAGMWEAHDPAFSRAEFYDATNYRGGVPEGIPV